MKKHSSERLMNVLLAPVVSEKSTFVGDRNRQYVFRVADRCDQARDQGGGGADVQDQGRRRSPSSNVRGKEKRFGRFIGRKRSWKKAYVRLAEGQEINFAATE